MILIADLGATNARFCTTEDGISYSNHVNYPISNYSSIIKLCESYITNNGLKGLTKGVVGVAAPVLGDKISFVNIDLTFSKRELEQTIFKDGLIVVNDLELQAYALFNLQDENLKYIGNKKLSSGPKILVAPGTGLGLAGVVKDSVVPTEAGHINISDKVLRPDLKKIVDRFVEDNSRVPTYEDFLSGKGISYFYSTLSGKLDSSLSSEDILANRSDLHCINTINLLNYLFSSYLRYVTLVWGAQGGVLLSGSIVNSLLREEDFQEFRQTFEDSETMKNFMEAVPLAILDLKDIGFEGGLELAKKLI